MNRRGVIMENDSWKNNIEGIIDKLKESAKLTIKFKKFNGISFEGKLPIDGNREEAIKEMENLLSKFELKPYQIGENKEVSNAYMVQFPELDVIYSNEEKIKIYKLLFKFSLDNINENRKEVTPKHYILDYINLYVKMAIQGFYRSCINPYKINEDDLLNDLEYRNHLETLFISYVDEYLNEKALIE